MSERRTLLDAAAFFDAPESRAIAGVPVAAARAVVQRFLAACYEDVGKAPKYLDAVDIEQVLVGHLPARFGARDPLAEVVEAVLEVYLRYLHEVEIVPAAFEQKLALDRNIEAFRARVAAGDAHTAGLRGAGKTIQARGDKVGRNDPCPCGSGKKFKKCCSKLGE